MLQGLGGLSPLNCTVFFLPLRKCCKIPKCNKTQDLRKTKKPALIRPWRKNLQSCVSGFEAKTNSWLIGLIKSLIYELGWTGKERKGAN